MTLAAVPAEDIQMGEGAHASHDTAVCNMLMDKLEGQFRSWLAHVCNCWKNFQYQNWQGCPQLTVDTMARHMEEFVVVNTDLLITLRKIWRTQQCEGPAEDEEEEGNVPVTVGPEGDEEKASSMSELQQATFERIW